MVSVMMPALACTAMPAPAVDADNGVIGLPTVLLRIFPCSTLVALAVPARSALIDVPALPPDGTIVFIRVVLLSMSNVTFPFVDATAMSAPPPLSMPLLSNELLLTVNEPVEELL